MTDCGARRMSRAKLVVLGRDNCGKTALCVRFITKRFIGEYDHKKEVTYRCRKTVDKETIDLEILDTVNKACVSFIRGHFPSSLYATMEYLLWIWPTCAGAQVKMEECMGPASTSLESSIKWGDGFLIMYSVTDRSSFEAVSRLKRLIDHVKQTLGIPTVIVANKSDMENGRAVRTEEGQALARDLRCSFFEVSVAEGSSAVEAAFGQLIREVRLEFQRHLLAMDKRSRVLQMRHVLKNKLTRSKTMQW
ncbi:ras-related and estrogen-regulated growth inhibitor isoform X1 [Astyanax mexicanus]|uniref:small monomeric GTPase n=2 Tax=Astyanax mexicanus TaxID=7994 RepID=A0A8T2KNN5_ASTMX|nr:ras-related and estrogen-regulated growth inhibitor isoform X1 [Astyanax mexicanus]KAG9260983.1 ras-related and estrogen-regulated growth inhibitor-like [Astyanax mexicanus]